MKNSLSNELNKKRRRYQSIILPNNYDIVDFTQKYRDKDKSKEQSKGVQKTNTIDKGKINRMSIHDIIKKRGLANPKNNGDLEEMSNINTESNESKKIKSSLYKTNKAKLNKNQNEDPVEVKTADDGVKYIVFEFRHDLKMIYRKAKWKLAKTKIISIFLKAVKPKVEENSYKNNKKKNNRVLFNVGENSKNNDDNIILNDMRNKTTIDKLYKRKGNNQKLVKGSLRKNGKSNIYLNDNQEDDSDNSSSIQNNRKIKKKNEKENDNFSRGTGNSNNKLFFDLLTNNSYNNGKKDEAFKNINSNSNSNSSDEKEHNGHKNNYIINSDYLDDYFKNNFVRRVDRRGYTSGYRRSPNNQEYLLEENKKNINKVKSKKAKIIKFKSLFPIRVISSLALIISFSSELFLHKTKLYGF